MTALRAALIVLAFFLLPRLAVGQIGPMCQQGCLATVEVTPDGTLIPQLLENSTNQDYTFFVKNGTASRQTYTLNCYGRNNVTCTSIPSQVTLSAGARNSSHTIISYDWS